MSDVRGCNIPDDLYYWVEKHAWARDDGSGEITVGITDVAQHLAARVVAITTKKVGKVLERGQSVATVESGKWVGPVPTPVDGEVTAVNANLAGDPTLVNSDPYGAGWIVRIRPSAWDDQKGALASGPAGLAAYEAFLAAEGISCA
ncbi:MAG: glycine cleavage system protein [Chloroflexi bacterium]|nr:glycine cleavage system protein [Chloroflexota bacterium]